MNLREPTWANLIRRSISIPFYLFLTALTTILFPVFLPLAVIADRMDDHRMPITRTVVFLLYYLYCECLGLIGTVVLSTMNLAMGGVPEARYREWHSNLQWAWAGLLLGGAGKIFSMTFEVEGQDQIGDTAPLVFIRHVSVGDTLVSSVFCEKPKNFLLRYVIKSELLWDPCVDICGQRTGAAFVRRDGADPEVQAERVRRLGRSLGPNEGALIYPEGTRFTEEKRSRIIERLMQASDTGLAERAKELRYVLPPRLSGPFALLDECPNHDVLFIAHVGFDKLTTFHDLWSGALIDCRIRVAFWRVPATEIPKERHARIDWLYEEWQRVDNWVGRKLLERSESAKL